MHGIITIIVLLILAGISIAMIHKSNLLEKSKLANNKWKNAENDETSILNSYNNEISNIGKNSREQANNENISDGTMIESTLIDRQTSVSGKTFNYQKGNYKTFLIATYYFTYGSAQNLSNNAKISCENINYNEVTYTCYTEKINSATSVNRLFILKPTDENFSVTFQSTDTFCIYGFNDELSITQIKGNGNFRGLNTIETNNYDYFLVGINWYQKDTKDLSTFAYIFADKHQVEKIMESAYPVVDNQTSCNGVQRVFLIKTNNANPNCNILTTNGTDSCYICGVNVK